VAGTSGSATCRYDGSVFPTSLGANPQLSIYGLVARNASLLAAELSGRPLPAIL